MKKVELPHFINKNARLGKNVEIGFGVYVDDNVIIGDNIKIGNFTVLYNGTILMEDVIIGDHCIIGHPPKLELQKKDFTFSSPKVRDLIIREPIAKISAGSIVRSHSVIYKHVILEEKVKTGHGVLIREHTKVAKSSVVGSKTQLDGYISVGEKSMIQSRCYIAQSTRVGKGVFIAPGCLFLDNKEIILGLGLDGPIIEDFVRIGGGAKILPKIIIGKGALIGAGAVVTKNVPPKAVAFGVPAKIKRFQSDEKIRTYIDSIKRWE